MQVFKKLRAPWKRASLSEGGELGYNDLTGELRYRDHVAGADRVIAGYRALLSTVGGFGGTSQVAAGTAYFAQDGTRIVSGAGEVGNVHARPFLVWNAAEWPGVSLMNLQASLTTTVAQTGLTFKVGLYSVVVSGTSTQIFTLTLVAGTEVTFTAPAAGAELSGVTADFTPPAAGLYVIGLTHSGGSTPSNSVTTFSALLRGK